MSIADIEANYIPPRTYLTGYGVPLLYAPDRLHIAEVGPCDPPKLVEWKGETWMALPLILVATVRGEEYRDNPRYVHPANP